MKYPNRNSQKPARSAKCAIRILLPAIAVGLLLTGCAPVGPDYTPIEPDAPQRWSAEMAGGLTASQPDSAALARWWTIFNDPELSSLEQRAVSGNLDLQTAQSRVREARALRGISQARLFPFVDARAAASKMRTSESGGTGTQTQLYTAGFDAGWELDIFGGLRRSVEASQADLEASQENLDSVLISLMAEVALSYVDVRTNQAQLTLTRANIKTQEETYKLNRSRNQAGIIDELAVQQSLRILESSRSQIPVIETRLAAAKNSLAVLLGRQPGEFAQELTEQKAIPALPATVAVGIPAETLRRRPDVRFAERVLAAQTARIGVATADLYPKFHLTGTIGLESINSDDFFNWGSHIWRYGPNASWKVFDAGAIRQNIQVQTARQEQALIQYQQTVLNAQEEVENALVAYAKEQRRRDSLDKAATAAQRAELLAKDKYQAGLVDFNNVLDAQRSLIVLQNELSQSTGAAAANLVRLYKSLGGGWEYASLVEEPSNQNNKGYSPQTITP
jgi:NodT family efflux transporter outer membrane factor (OMF) lipoprotein